MQKAREFTALEIPWCRDACRPTYFTLRSGKGGIGGTS